MKDPLIYHLRYVTGGALCSQEVAPEHTVERREALPDGARLCLRCVRRLNGLPITQPVPPHLARKP